MMPDLLTLLANLGAGVLVGWLVLPVFARITALRFVHDPASSHRALLWAFVLALAVMLVPWVRGVMPHGAPLGNSTGGSLALSPGAHGNSVAGTASTLAFYALCVIGAAWLVSATLAAVLAVLSLVQLGALIRRSRPAPAAAEGALSRCHARGIEKVRRVLVSDEASVPFAAVPWFPVLVLPASFPETFDPPALELMLAHEVTHLDRGDLWTSALVRVLCIAFPFHPTASRLADDIAFAREAAVDAHVSVRDPHGYATLLLDVAANARFDQLPRPVSMDDTALQRRISLLTDGSRKRPLSIAPLVVTAAGVLVLLVFVASPVSATTPPVPMAAPPNAGTVVRQGEFVLRLPDSSYAACEGKASGDLCPFAVPGGELSGTCAEDDKGRKLCLPPPPPGKPSLVGRGAR